MNLSELLLSLPDTTKLRPLVMPGYFRLPGLPFALSEQGPWVAGGLLRRGYEEAGRDGADIDVFFRTQEQMDAARDALIAADYACDLITPYSETWGKGDEYPVNLVTSHLYADAQEVVDGFDMTLCQFVAWSTDNVLATIDAINAVGCKSIKFRHTDSVAATLRRAVKYGEHGYMARDEEIHRFLKQHLGTPAFDNVREPISG